VAIVGIPGALEAGNAFYIATGRVTEVCLGIIVAATVNHIILPSSLGPELWQAVIGGRQALADYALALFERRGDSGPSRTKLLGQAIAIENLRASAIFEDREIRDRSDRLRFLDTALIDAIAVAQPLGQQLDTLERSAYDETGLDYAITDAAGAIRAWRATAMDADALSRRLLRAQAHLPLVWPLCRDPSIPDDEVIRRTAMIARLGEFFTALTAYAGAYEASLRRREQPRARSASPTQTTRWGRCGRECAPHWQSSLSAHFGFLPTGRTGLLRRSLASWRPRDLQPWRPQCRLPSLLP
jgi:uncharacterized membrane protein YccC